MGNRLLVIITDTQAQYLDQILKDGFYLSKQEFIRALINKAIKERGDYNAKNE